MWIFFFGSIFGILKVDGFLSWGYGIVFLFRLGDYMNLGNFWVLDQGGFLVEVLVKRCLEGMILGFIFLVYLSFLMDVGWKYKFIRGCLINGRILRILKALLFMLLCYLLGWFFGCFKLS